MPYHLKSIIGMRTVNVALCALCVALHRLSVPVYDHPFTLNKINYVFIERLPTIAELVISPYPTISQQFLGFKKLAFVGVINSYRMCIFHVLQQLSPETKGKQKIIRFQSHHALSCSNYLTILFTSAAQRENLRPHDRLCEYLNIPVFDLH